MLSIDADAHVIETEKTWDYLEGCDRRYRPVPITVDMSSGKRQNFWIIGGRLIGGRDRYLPIELREDEARPPLDGMSDSHCSA